MISSRRKSCSACARGKRRCDLGFPQCGRCLARRVTCVYAWISPQEAQEVVQNINSSLWNPHDIRQDHLNQSGPAEISQLNHGLPGPGEIQANNDTTFGPPPLTLSPALVPLVDEVTGRGRTISFLAPDLQLQSLNKSFAEASSDLRTPQHLHNIQTTSFQVPNDSSIYASKGLQARVEYAASRLVYQVRALAETGQTVFIHHSRIDGSAVLRDALAACSLSITRNSVNESLVFAEITRRAELLKEAVETATSLTPPRSPSAVNLDLLPAVQAMLIYQCMRLFSTGDIALQAQAELDAESLGKWVGSLREQSQWSRDNLSGDTQHHHLVWEDWIRAESIQRTIIFAELLDGTYNFLRFGWYRPSARIAKLGFTGQVALWEARSSAEWHQVRGQKPWIELNMSSFHDGIKAALPSDLDELGIIILVSYDGVDALEAWLGDDRRLLEKWGLGSRNGFFSLWH